MRRLDYPACDYDPDAELVEDDRRLDLGLEPCRALVHERQCWWLRPWRLWGARMGFAVPPGDTHTRARRWVRFMRSRCPAGPFHFVFFAALSRAHRRALPFDTAREPHRACAPLRLFAVVIRTDPLAGAPCAPADAPLRAC